MFIDFNQEVFETVEDYIETIIYDHNHLRPNYAFNYKNPNRVWDSINVWIKVF